MSGPRMSHMNGNNRRPTNLHRVPSNEKPPCSQHDDIIKYICDSWNKVTQEVNDRCMGAKFYQETENHSLKDFEPFDLDRLWDRRSAQSYQQTQHS